MNSNYAEMSVFKESGTVSFSEIRDFLGADESSALGMSDLYNVSGSLLNSVGVIGTNIPTSRDVPISVSAFYGMSIQAPGLACVFTDYEPVTFLIGGNNRRCFAIPGAQEEDDEGEGLYTRQVVGTSDCVGIDTQEQLQAARDEAAANVIGMDSGVPDFNTFSELLPLLIAAVENTGQFTFISSRVQWGTGVTPRDYIAALITKHNLNQLAVLPCIRDRF